MELQGNGHPLVLADAAVIVGFEERHLVLLIEGGGLQVQAGGVDVGGADVDALAEGLVPHHRQHDGLAPVHPVELVAGLDGHATGEGLEPLGLGQTDGLGDGLPLGLGGVQVVLVVLTIGVQLPLLGLTQAVPAVLGLVEEGFPAELAGGLLLFIHVKKILLLCGYYYHTTNQNFLPGKS